jgi:hypothetical protein
MRITEAVHRDFGVTCGGLLATSHSDGASAGVGFGRGRDSLIDE